MDLFIGVGIFIQLVQLGGMARLYMNRKHLITPNNDTRTYMHQASSRIRAGRL